ncbi:Crp/Fnr family transcriptional regulator [Aquimarina intermedia]|uniref:CRP-like cAMP-binding protein n=1 Tax=Aquimarina intermedia TaxID=350814 RepID=A0A5S5C742_9FLAO|nr:Crp/Fnr family transcriptional regulator [Aquimarina intermedia]TYP74418.1 CRP-like cAMP-binding protein [Aquimarina intermedia]
MKYELILKNISRFINLNQEEQDLYISLFTEKKIKKKDFLLRQGEIARHDYFITKGCLKVYNIDTKGSEHISMFAVKDWWSGDMASFITQQPANYFIQALEESEVLQISKENFDLLFERIPKFERFYRILYQRSLVTYIQRSDQNISFSAEDRYLNFIKKYPSLLNRISQKNIAAYLGVTPEFLSLLRKKMASM